MTVIHLHLLAASVEIGEPKVAEYRPAFAVVAAALLGPVDFAESGAKIDQIHLGVEAALGLVLQVSHLSVDRVQLIVDLDWVWLEDPSLALCVC